MTPRTAITFAPLSTSTSAPVLKVSISPPNVSEGGFSDPLGAGTDATFRRVVLFRVDLPCDATVAPA